MFIPLAHQGHTPGYGQGVCHLPPCYFRNVELTFSLFGYIIPPEWTFQHQGTTLDLAAQLLLTGRSTVSSEGGCTHVLPPDATPCCASRHR